MTQGDKSLFSWDTREDRAGRGSDRTEEGVWRAPGCQSLLIWSFFASLVETTLEIFFFFKPGLYFKIKLVWRPQEIKSSNQGKDE